MDISPEMLQKKILIVDDAASMRTLTKAILREAGFAHVFDVPGGREALMMMAKVKINVVICDWNMPGMSGIELYQAVKDDEKLATPPWIMLTSSSDGDKVKEAISVGITSYIVKPFKPDNLINQLVAKLKAG
ncbi:MAG: response regulator [Methylococcales bacterium]|jgi:two-component system chemotaxis response regulator CheY|nr:response regulator [Methylococcales bacterium]MDD5754531.1 response regulator [Methylococcales bacterium]